MCDKLTYSKKDAEATLKHIIQKRVAHRKEQRIYYCKIHNAWHLTSRQDIFENPIKETNLRFAKKWVKLLKQT